MEALQRIHMQSGIDVGPPEAAAVAGEEEGHRSHWGGGAGIEPSQVGALGIKDSGSTSRV